MATFKKEQVDIECSKRLFWFYNRESNRLIEFDRHHGFSGMDMKVLRN